MEEEIPIMSSIDKTKKYGLTVKLKDLESKKSFKRTLFVDPDSFYNISESELIYPIRELLSKFHRKLFEEEKHK